MQILEKVIWLIKSGLQSFALEISLNFVLTLSRQVDSDQIKVLFKNNGSYIKLGRVSRFKVSKLSTENHFQQLTGLFWCVSST